MWISTNVNSGMFSIHGLGSLKRAGSSMRDLTINRAKLRRSQGEFLAEYIRFEHCMADDFVHPEDEIHIPFMT